MPLNPGYPVQLDKPRLMRFGCDSAERAEEEFGIYLMQFDTKKMGIKAMKQIIFASLLENDPTLKYEQIGAIIDAYEPGLIDLFEKAGRAVQDFFRASGQGKSHR